MCQILSKIISHYSKITPYNISLSFFWCRHKGSEHAEGLGPWRWWMGQWLRPHLGVWMQPHTWTAHRSLTKAYLVGWDLVWGISRRTASGGKCPTKCPTKADRAAHHSLSEFLPLCGWRVWEPSMTLHSCVASSLWATGKNKYMKRQLK